MRAIMKKDEAAVAGVLDSQLAHVNDFDVFGNTALHYAARHGNAAIVRCLLAAGAAMHAVSRTGLSGHDIALMAGHQAIAGLLEERGYQKAALQQPCELYQRLLLDNGAVASPSGHGAGCAASVIKKAD
jgi:ankyrin repeat protein